MTVTVNTLGFWTDNSLDLFVPKAAVKIQRKKLFYVLHRMVFRYDHISDRRRIKGNNVNMQKLNIYWIKGEVKCLYIIVPLLLIEPSISDF